MTSLAKSRDQFLVHILPPSAVFDRAETVFYLKLVLQVFYLGSQGNVSPVALLFLFMGFSFSSLTSEQVINHLSSLGTLSKVLCPGNRPPWANERCWPSLPLSVEACQHSVLELLHSRPDDLSEFAGCRPTVPKILFPQTAFPIADDNSLFPVAQASNRGILCHPPLVFSYPTCSPNLPNISRPGHFLPPSLLPPWAKLPLFLPWIIAITRENQSFFYKTYHVFQQLFSTK